MFQDASNHGWLSWKGEGEAARFGKTLDISWERFRLSRSQFGLLPHAISITTRILTPMRWALFKRGGKASFNTLNMPMPKLSAKHIPLFSQKMKSLSLPLCTWFSSGPPTGILPILPNNNFFCGGVNCHVDGAVQSNGVIGPMHSPRLLPVLIDHPACVLFVLIQGVGLGGWAGGWVLGNNDKSTVPVSGICTHVPSHTSTHGLHFSGISKFVTYLHLFPHRVYS